MGAAADRGDLTSHNSSSVDSVRKSSCFSTICASPQEVVRQSILTNQIPRAQAVLRRLNRPEQRLPALKMEGLRQVFSCLQGRDLQTASRLLTNMVDNPQSDRKRLKSM